jgi:hemoglobin
MSEELSLYSRLGGYDAIAAVSENLLGRLMADPLLGRFWANRSDDGIRFQTGLRIRGAAAS